MNLEQARREGLIAQRQCRYGTMQFLRTDYWIARSLGQYGEFSEGEVELWRWLLRPGDTVVSAGANCGAHVVALASIVGPQGRVFSAEPQRLFYELTAANITANELAQATIAHAALGSIAGTAYFPRLDYRWAGPFGTFGVTTAMDAEAEAVEMTTIDRLVGDAAVRMIHLDVEGAELTALRGASQTIARCRPLLYVETDREARFAELMAWLQENRYQPLQHTPPLFNPDNFAGNASNVFGKTASANTLAVPV
jgi:FkbM family methyltransferase